PESNAPRASGTAVATNRQKMSDPRANHLATAAPAGSAGPFTASSLAITLKMRAALGSSALTGLAKLEELVAPSSNWLNRLASSLRRGTNSIARAFMLSAYNHLANSKVTMQ